VLDVRVPRKALHFLLTLVSASEPAWVLPLLLRLDEVGVGGGMGRGSRPNSKI
jgi:hypothetical protein